MEENNIKLKKGFFKKVWYSIIKLEKYGEMSAEGLSRAIKYLIQISLIMAIILSLGTIYQINEKVKKGVEFLNNEVGEFSYKDGILKVEKDMPIRAPSSTVGEIIIDTNVQSEEEINQYMNSIEEKMGILILKDKVMIKGLTGGDTISYKYSTLLNEIGITQIDRQGAINYFNSSAVWSIYIQIFIIICIYTLISTFLSIITNVLILSLFGWIATWFARIKMRYVAIFNLAVYSLTLSVFLQASYAIVNILTGFNMTYFQVMYVAVAAIYLIAAIFLIKSEFLRSQIQEIKSSAVVKIKKTEDEENEDSDEDDKKENKDKDKEEGAGNKKEEKKEEKDNNVGEGPEGSEA